LIDNNFKNILLICDKIDSLLIGTRYMDPEVLGKIKTLDEKFISLGILLLYRARVGS
jgi:hypothetical protein